MFLGVVACGREAAAEAPANLPAPGRESVAIADPEIALTFARTRNGDRRRLLAVLEYRDGRVGAVDLNLALGIGADDPIDAYTAAGYEALRSAIASAPASARVGVAARDLVAPVDLGAHHVAAGTNFPEHAGEAAVEDGPFLFPKLVQPTDAYAEVPVAGRLLDYEAELAWVTVEPLARDSMPESMGLVLCNDYTDRETLLRGVDPWEPASGKGFATGKSFPGYLPIGNLFVIPRDYRAFAAAIELHLYVNGEIRQRAHVHQAIWQIDELVRQTWGRSGIRWEHRGASVSLLDGRDVIPARTLLLGGTPSGTNFRGVSLRQKVRGVGSWLFGGWGRSVPAHVVDAYVAAARERGFYLKAKDRVLTYAPRLGLIDNTIVP